MPTEIALGKLDKKITALSDALAHLGKGTDLKELLRIIRFPGWTTPAELAFTVAILDSMQSQVNQLTKLSGALAKGSETGKHKRVIEYRGARRADVHNADELAPFLYDQTDDTLTLDEVEKIAI